MKLNSLLGRSSAFVHNSSSKRTVLTDLLVAQRWQDIEQALSNPLAHISIDEGTRVTEEIIVHYACRCGAPLKIIQLLSARYPLSLMSKDCRYRYPLHHACKQAASPSVIDFLIRTNPSVAGFQDCEHKTPLLYTAAFYVDNCNLRYKEDVTENVIEVVKLLKAVAPASFNLEDAQGMCAAEHALNKGLDIKIVKTIQRACRDDWRDRRREERGTGKRHEDLAKELEFRSSRLQQELQCDNKSVAADGTSFHIIPVSVQANQRAARSA